MGGGGDFGSGSGSKFNCAARVGSGQTISGTVSFESVQTSNGKATLLLSVILINGACHIWQGNIIVIRHTY